MSRADQPAERDWIDRWLFPPVDPTAAAIFRIALASMVIVVFWPQSRGGLPETLGPSLLIESLFERVFLTSQYWVLVVMTAALLALGVWPRPVGVTLGALLLPLVLIEGRQPGRQLLTVTVLAFSFVRSDAALALPLRQGPARRSAGPCWPIRIVQLQLSLLYAANAISKTTPDYLSGRTLAAMMQVLPNFLVRPSDGHLEVGAVSIPLWFAATGVVLTEYALAIGFWFPRTRVATAMLGVLFHGALRYVIRIGFLDVVSVFLYMAFLLPFVRRRG